MSKKTSNIGGKVFKYQLQEAEEGHCYVIAPQGALFLKYDIQYANHVIWLVVNPENPPQDYTFTITGTGFDAPPNAIHRGTAFEGPFVWHLFEEYLVEIE